MRNESSGRKKKKGDMYFHIIICVDDKWSEETYTYAYMLCTEECEGDK